MTSTTAFRRAALAVLAVTCLATASAYAADESGQTPPSEPAQSAQKPEEPKCVTDKSGFRQQDGKASFVVELTNGCQSRLKCTVNAYIVNAYGPVKGHGTLILGPKANGPGTVKSYVIKLKEPNGSANVSYKCAEI